MAVPKGSVALERSKHAPWNADGDGHLDKKKMDAQS
jgi:hypothetical protein